jgi:hypothetical protein
LLRLSVMSEVGIVSGLSPRGGIMPPVPPFYSMREAEKPLANRVHHDNGTCAVGRAIPLDERLKGNAGYRLCDDCENLNTLGR